MSQVGSFPTNQELGDVVSLTGNSGGAVGPDGSGNINVVGSGGVLVTGDPSTNTLTITAGTSVLNYTTVSTTPYTVLSTDDYLGVNCSSSAITIKLPNAPTTGRVYIIKDSTGNAQTNNITVTTVGGSVTIDGATTFVMNTQYEAIQVIFNGTSYEIF